MKKKFISVLLAGVLTAASLGVFAACGGGGGNGPTTTGELKKDENGNVIFENVEIVCNTVVSGTDKDAFEQIVQQFNIEHRGEITVHSESIGDGTFEISVPQRISNNSNAPDLIMAHQKVLKSFENNNLLQSFDEAMELSGIEIDMEDYAEGLAQYSSLGEGDSLYAVPVDAQSMIVYYNKAKLEELGGQLPTTRAELMDLLQRAKDKYGSGFWPIAWATANDYFARYAFPTAVLQNGGEFFDTESLYAEWAEGENEEAFKDAIESIRELIYDKNFAQYGRESVLEEYLSDNFLFYLTLPWSNNEHLSAYADEKGINVSEVSDYLGATSLSGWFAMDETEPSADVVFGDSHFFAMSRTVQDINQKAAILEFIRYFTQNAEIGTQWARAGHVSASKIISQSQAYQSDSIVSNYFINFYPDLDDFRCMGLTPAFKEIQTNMNALFVSTVGKPSVTDEVVTSEILRCQEEVNAIVDFIK